MKKTKELRLHPHLPGIVMTVAFILLVFLAADRFSIVSHAESQATVTAQSANIRQAPDSGSTVIGSAQKDKTISIRSQTTGSDGNIWYQVFVDANTLGYIRSDLVSITDGTTPPTEAYTASTGTTDTNASDNTNTGTSDAQTPAAEETPVAVTAVQPVSANVTGGQSVRVRSNASTTSQIVTTAQDGLAITVTGQATGTDGNVWYQVTFIADGTEVTGFIRSDYVTLSGELVPVTEEAPGTETGEEIPEETQPVQETKDWDTQLQGSEWYLINNVEGNQYLIQDLFDGVEQNAALYEESNQKVSTQRTAIIILVILLVLLAAAVAFLVFKIKDMTDSAYFSEVEKETLQKRGDRRQGASSQKVIHTVGTGKQAGTRPTGSRSTGAAQGARVAGTRPAGGQSPAQGARTAGAGPAGGQSPVQGARTAGARPAGGQSPAQGARTAGARPAGGQSPAQGARTAGARPTGGQSPAQGVRPIGTRSAEKGTVSRTAKPSSLKQTGNAQNPGWKSKNFMADDDEFEFEFLNWDGDEEQ